MNRIGTIFLLASAMGGSSAYGAAVQWTVGSGGNGHYYEYFGVPNITWTAARANALGAGGYLATVTSAGENTFVLAQLIAAGVDRAYLGANDAAVEGTFRWIDGPEAGNALVYSNFAPGEPNNFGDEDYLEILNITGGVYTPGSWNDLPDSNPFAVGYVVEYNSAPGGVPEPSTWALTLGGLAGWLVMRRRG